MKLSIEKEYQFIPEWNGNKEDEKPIEFNLRGITDLEREKCITKKYVDGNVEMATNESQLFRYAVQGIENLEINNKQIKSASEFLACSGLSGLFAEVVLEILTRTVKKDLKN